MKLLIRYTLLCGTILVGSLTHAAAPATIELVRSAAWLELAGKRVALAPGHTLEQSGRIITGEHARVVVRLGEGSTVKLGADARFTFSHTLDVADNALFKAALEVLKGAFRFTTTALSRDFQRDIRATVGTATIGIRGTDVWGKAADDRDFVVLLEGEIEITRDGATVAMSTPQTIFNAPQGGPAEPVMPVDPAALTIWAAETEPLAGTGVATVDGAWRVIVGDYRHAPSANALLTLLHSAGYPALLVTTQNTGATRHQVLLNGFPTEGDAITMSSALKTQFPTLNPAVSAP